jgi:ATP-dependent RNA helicase SUPV3L1/SUV3
MPISFSSPTPRDARARGAGVTAVLGPTNTGKTHLAIERMLAHSSGLIGLPLRLLAREVYNKVVDRVGAENVALITGEEKIKPKNPRFWVSTVEAMPRDLDCAFVAIDEIQLGSDLDRGHVFTDRMLNRRGREETLVLGAATVRPMVERLLPGANIVQRPRLSTLIHSGDRKITRLPRRTAIVAFSADEVYAVAELIRRQRGGAAVVLGALSPRTRNAQVELYQSGDVDYLIATDAIGMGLNLDVRQQIRWLPIPQAQPLGNGADRRPRRPRPARWHLRHHRPLSAIRQRSGPPARKSCVRADQSAAMAQH